MQKKLIAPGYLHDFKCLAGDCEDTCCQGWDLNLEKARYEILLKKTALHPEDLALIESTIFLHDQDYSSKDKYAFIKLAASGYCPLLTAAGLCHLRTQYGIEVLNDVCTFFPRVFSTRDDVAELTGALSCPEVVRKCLFSEADEQRMTTLGTDVLPRPDYPASRMINTSSDRYFGKFEQVREQMISLMNDSDYSFETRLYFVANFCYRLSSHYHHGCDSNKRVDEEIERINNTETKSKLDDYYFKFNNTEPIAIIVIQAILQLCIQHQGDDKLTQLTRDILDIYKVNYERSEDFDVYGENIPPDKLATSFQQHWQKLNSRYGVKLEEYLVRYVTNCLQREWFISLPDPFVYIHMLTIRVAVLRFLITSHPDIISLVNSDTSYDDSINDFNTKIVEVIYLYARSIDHNQTFLHIVYQALLEQQLMSFDYSMAFIKF